MLMMTTMVGTCMSDKPPKCKKMGEIYTSGKDICDKLWDGNFKYEEKEDEAYTMWFFDSKNNPNDVVSETLRDKGVFQAALPLDMCYLEEYNHKGDGHPVSNSEHPTEEPDSFQECHPWSETSCCFQETVSTVKKIKESYGPEYHWDRCGPMSQACERFFVMESCFYECDPNVGIYRKHKNTADDPDPFGGEQPLFDGTDATNGWGVHQMPIKASFFDAWYQACKDDYFCGDGSYWDCANQWEAGDAFVDSNALQGSCENSCGGKAKNGPCRCDASCSEDDPITCCADRATFCEETWVTLKLGSCEGVCGGKSDAPGNCWCDENCKTKGDCCDDIVEQCQNSAPASSGPPPGSCAGACGGKTKTEGLNCYCDNNCVAKGDCCADLPEQCPPNGSPNAPGCSATGNC